MLKYLTLLLTLIALPAFGQSTLGGGTVGIPGLTTNSVRERHLKAVDAPADEECLTYEGTVGDFEWQSCIAGAVTDVTGTAPIASSGGATPAISITADGIDFTEIADDMTLDGNLTIEAPAAENITIDSRTTPSTQTFGTVRYEHTAGAGNTRAIELEIDANSFPSTHAVRVDLHATALAAGEVMIGYHVSADTSTSTGGMIEAVRVDKAGAGTAEVHALHIDPGIDVIHQETGTFGAIESAWENAVEVTSELNDTGTDLTLFSSNSDILYIGDAATFNELEVNLDTFAGGAGIKPTFEFSNDGAGGWDTFTPVDGTDGFRETGIIEWTIGDLTNWQTDTVNGVANKFWIRITRTQVSVPTDPIEDTIQILMAAEFGWDEDGDIDVRQILASGTANLQDNILQRANLLDTSIVTQAFTGTGNKTISVPAGNSVTHVAFGAIDWTFADPTATNAMSTIYLSLITGGTGAQTWPATVIWENGSAPVLLDTEQEFTSDFGADDKIDITTHGLINGQMVHATNSGGALPAGLTADTIYFVINKTTNDLEVSLTLGGSAVDITDDGTGTQTLHSGENRLKFITVDGGVTWLGVAPVSTGFAMDAGTQILGAAGTSMLPSWSFEDDPDTGVYISTPAANRFVGVSGGLQVFMALQGGGKGILVGSIAGSWRLIDQTPTDVIPTVMPNGSDVNSGLVWAGEDKPGIGAGGVNAVTWEEASGQILVKNSVHVGLTANSGGGGVGSCLQLLSSYNVISVSAAPGDSVCAPTAVAGYGTFIVNNGASAVDVYPFTDDNLGGGVNTAVSLAAGSNIRYFAIDGVNWEVM